MKLALMVVLMVVLTLMTIAPVSAGPVDIEARKGGGGRGGKPKPKKPDKPKTECDPGANKCGSGSNEEEFWLYNCNSAGSWERKTDCTNGCVGSKKDHHCF